MRPIFLFSLVLISSIFAFGRNANSEFMDLKAAQQKWGNKKFAPAKFKMGGEKLRATMAVDLIKTKQYIGSPLETVTKALGTGDGYLDTDSIPAYLLESRKTGEKKDSWQLVFLADKSGKVAEVKIHKNCCYSKDEY